MNPGTAMRAAAAAGFLAVALGAFGAHSLKNLLAQNGTATIWETAVFYHFVHALMLFILANRKRVVVFPRGNCDFFRLALFAGGYERALARRGDAHRRPEFSRRLGLAARHSRQK